MELGALTGEQEMICWGSAGRWCILGIRIRSL